MTDYLQFAEQQTLKFFSAVLPLQLQKDENKNYSKSSSVRRIFERGGGRKFENNEEQNENFPPQNQVRFPAQN